MNLFLPGGQQSIKHHSGLPASPARQSFCRRALFASSLPSCSTLRCFLAAISAPRTSLSLALRLAPFCCFVYEAMRRANGILHGRWLAIQKQDSRPLDLSRLQELQFNQDTAPEFAALDSIGTRGSAKDTVDFQPKDILTKASAAELPTDLPSRGDVLNLAAFEAWVAAHLDAWVASRLDRPVTCGQPLL